MKAWILRCPEDSAKRASGKRPPSDEAASGPDSSSGSFSGSDSSDSIARVCATSNTVVFCAIDHSESSKFVARVCKSEEIVSDCVSENQSNSLPLDINFSIMILAIKNNERAEKHHV